MRTHAALVAVLCLAPLTPACGASSSNRPAARQEANVRTISENRALTLIAEILAEEGIARGPLWTVPVAQGREIDVDIRLAQSSYGIEWMSPQDRADLGDTVPGPAEGGRLRIVPGFGEGHTDEQVLILEHSSYEFVNEREHVEGGLPSARETEVRLHRDVRDFIHYVQGQGGL